MRPACQVTGKKKTAQKGNQAKTIATNPISTNGKPQGE